MSGWYWCVAAGAALILGGSVVLGIGLAGLAHSVLTALRRPRQPRRG